MIEVFQAFDRTPIAKLESDDTAALDRKFEAATRLFADRRAWLTPSEKPNDRQYIFGRLEDPEDIAQFGPLSRVLDEPSQSTGETGEYSEDEVARMAHTLAVKAVTTT